MEILKVWILKVLKILKVWIMKVLEILKVWGFKRSERSGRSRTS